ncbi:MAG: Fe-S-containing hydro-lyase [Chitinivibrionales bacterium]|nr:Fe-S-containing hydro-lyase [Chitinivibrionales bacterium]MBD3355630.1 Fe-S-containing hydro-lyase [Chitinivibrionales bacterium]
MEEPANKISDESQICRPSNKILTPPFDDITVRSLAAGDTVHLSGTIFTARDAAHKRLSELIAARKPLPVDLSGQVLYFVGSTPAPPGRPVGSAGPTTSYRMDPYSPILIAEAGLRGMIGKGDRSPEVVEAMKKYGCVYFAAVGGAGALIATHICKAEVVCYEDLGPEAIHRFEVRAFPVIVAIDTKGNSLYRGKVSSRVL